MESAEIRRVPVRSREARAPETAPDDDFRFRMQRPGRARRVLGWLFLAILVCVCPVSGAIIQNDPGYFFVGLLHEAVFAAWVIAFAVFG